MGGPERGTLFYDWYIDSKRNLQWFESTSEHIEINGEIYNRIGNTVLLFSHNGQKVYGDEYGGIHYLYPLGEVVIGMRSKSFSSPLRGAGFYRIGNPAEHEGNFSSNFQYVAPINPGYINGLNGFSLSNGVKTNLFDAVVRYNFSDSQKWYQFRKLGKESNIRIEKTLGRVGSKYLKMSKMLGGAASATSTVIEIANYGIYTTTNGFDWMVTTKFGMDLIMTGIGFLGPVGLIVSTSYFILDVTTDGFGGFGKMY